MSVSAGALCFVVGAGAVDPALHLTLKPDDLLIAADAGWRTVEGIGLAPHLVVGDFDSLGARPDHPNTVVLPKEKDVTDMYAAVELGMERGYRRFVLYGGTGGRLAHTVANLQLLCDLAQRGCRGFLVGDGTTATAVHNGTLHFPARGEGYLSVFCAGDEACGVNLSGLKYQLTDARLTGNFPLGVSNEFANQPACVGVTRGTLLVLWASGEEDTALFASL